MDPTNDEPGAVWLACLCAAWCRTCDGYQPVLLAAAQDYAARLPDLRTRWIDIEDDSDLVGDVDVETFPTLLVFDARQVRFFGPLTPQPGTLRRLLQATLIDARGTARKVGPDVEALAARLRRAPAALAAQVPAAGGGGSR